MSQAGANSTSGGGGGGITTISGDIGSTMGPVVQFTAHPSFGSSPSFNISGTTVHLRATDSNSNTIIGSNAGNPAITGTGNVGLGDFIFNSLTTGASNISIGNLAAQQLITGNRNVCIGASAGHTYTSNESSNIVIGNIGVIADQNTVRIGTQGAGLGQQNLCFIAGITGATPVGANAPQVTLTDNTGNLTTITSNTSGFVLTSNGAGTTPTFQAAAAAGITTINGDSGSITGATVTIFANQATRNSGATVEFVNAGTTSTLDVSDGNGNTLIGNLSGGAIVSGINNTGLGSTSLGALAGGNANTALGFEVLQSLVAASSNTGAGSLCLSSLVSGNSNAGYGAGSLQNLNGGNTNSAYGNNSLVNLVNGIRNSALGLGAGSAYTAAESSNIVIGNTGQGGESHVIRIGTQGAGLGQQNLTFVAGITGATPVGANAPQVTLTDNTGNLTTITSSTSGFVLTSNGAGTTPTFQAVTTGAITWTDQAAPFTAATLNGYFITAALTATLPAAPAQGDTISFVLDTASALIIQANAGQTIRIGANPSSVAGTATSTSIGDSITLVFRTADNFWFSIPGTQGTFNLA